MAVMAKVPPPVDFAESFRVLLVVSVMLMVTKFGWSAFGKSETLNSVVRPWCFAIAIASKKRLSVSGQPMRPITKARSAPCWAKVFAYEPSLSKVKTALAGWSVSIERMTEAMWYEPAVCELEGPRMMGPITSLNMLSNKVVTPANHIKLFSTFLLYFLP